MSKDKPRDLSSIGPTQVLPATNNKDIGLDDLAMVALSRDEQVVIDELRRRRDSGVQVAEMTPAGIEMLERMTERVRARRGVN